VDGSAIDSGDSARNCASKRARQRVNVADDGFLFFEKMTKTARMNYERNPLAWRGML